MSVDLSWLFKLYKPGMYMIPKNDCISYFSMGLAYVFSGYFSGSGSWQIFLLVHVTMYSIWLYVKRWKHSNCIFASFVKLITPNLFLGGSADFYLPATALDFLLNTIFSFVFFVSNSFWRKHTNYSYGFCWNNKSI